MAVGIRGPAVFLSTGLCLESMVRSRVAWHMSELLRVIGGKTDEAI